MVGSIFCGFSGLGTPSAVPEPTESIPRSRSCIPFKYLAVWILVVQQTWYSLECFAQKIWPSGASGTANVIVFHPRSHTGYLRPQIQTKEGMNMKPTSICMKAYAHKGLSRNFTVSYLPFMPESLAKPFFQIETRIPMLVIDERLTRLSL